MYGARAAMFWKHWCYVDLIGRDGVRRLYRYRTSTAGRRQVEDFDHGQPFQPGTAFVLRPPGKGSTLTNKRKTGAKWRKTKTGKASRALASTRTMLRRAEAAYDQAVNIYEEAQETEKPESPRLLRAQQERQTARKRLNVLRQRVEVDVRRLDRISKNSGIKHPRHPRHMDLTTRNGAVGAYNFVALDN
jgi:hypothetical protein